MDAVARQETLKRLQALVGEWVVEAELPGQPPMTGRSVFEWTLDGQFLVQRTQAPNTVPASMALIAVDSETGCTYHYYDTRGVVRVYGGGVRGGEGGHGGRTDQDRLGGEDEAGPGTA